MSNSDEHSALLSQVRNLPEQAGVYQFFDSKGKIIYIGKAKNLKKRVASYFQKKQFDSYKVKVLVHRIVQMKYIVVSNESDALLLENNLIKKHQPRYNILLKDDKTFPWICIRKEHFPRVYSTRNVLRDGSEYFGPYTSAYAVKVLLTLVRQLYQLRTCNYHLSPENIAKGKFKVCLEYHIGNCLGPCEGLQDEGEYNESIRQIRQIVKGNLNEVIAFLKREMKKYADEFRFEEAHLFKEKIEILSRYQAKSTIVSPRIHNVDVFSIVSDEKEAYVNFLKVVKGAVVHAHTMEIKKKLDESDEDVLALAIADMRERSGSSSKEIITSIDLSSLFPGETLTIPLRGDKKKLLELSERNARTYRLDKRKRASQQKAPTSSQRILETLQKDLRLPSLPRHIECFDNSNIQGSNPVAACVVFRNAKPAKKDYRHYHIKTVRGPDDFASMEEVVYRRYRRLLEEEKALPQLIIIDGGKGQLNAALQSLDKLKLRGEIAIVGIAKKLEEIYFPGDPVPLYIDKASESLKLIQHLRNEAHRFGIEFHRQLRSNAQVESSLDQVPGIGAKSREKLFSHFKSMDAIRQASLKELTAVVGKARAEGLITFFSKP